MSDRDDRVPDPTTWARHLRAAVVERLGLKMVALVLALLLWLVVRVIHPMGAS